MKTLIKKIVTSLTIVVIVLAANTSLTSCSGENGNQHVNTKTKSTKGPKFKKEGDVWIVKNNSKDTLAHFDAEYAVSPEDQNYGMMYRKSMDENMSMLFFRDRFEMQSFWMKNTYVSLDIIYVDDQQRIVSIQKNAEPLNTRSLPSNAPALFVLEIKGGLSDKLGIQAGDKMEYRDI